MNPFRKNPSITGFGFLAFAQVMVGMNIVGSKYLVATIPVLFLITARFFIAAILLLPMHWLTKHRQVPIKLHYRNFKKKDWLMLIAQALCAGALFNVLMVLGLRYTDAQSAGIITSTLPALIAVGSWLILGEKFTLKKTICVGCATLGLIVISFHSAGNLSHSPVSLLGEVLVLLALMPEATYYILVKLQKNHLPIFLMSGTINAVNVLILIPLVLFFVNWRGVHLSSIDIIVLLTIGLASGFFYVFWFLGSNQVDSIMASLATAVMPIATVFIAWLSLGETITWHHFIGMSLAIISIILYVI